MTAGTDAYLVFAGPANPALARAVAAELEVELAPCEFFRFPDGEVSVRIATPVHGRHVLLVQPTGPPVNDRLVELLAFADASRRAGAGSITMVVPYFGYARSDRRQGERVPVAASMVATMFEALGVDHVVTVDVHSPQVEGFFRIPLDDVSAVPVLADALAARCPPDAVVVAPDLGAARLAAVYGRALGMATAVVHKHRRSATEVTATGITGGVAGRPCIIVDDMITTGGTIASAARALTAAGAAAGIVAVATHGVLTADAWGRLAGAGVRELLLTDSLAAPPDPALRTRVVSIAPLLAEAIRRTSAERKGASAVSRRPSAEQTDASAETA